MHKLKMIVFLPAIFCTTAFSNEFNLIMIADKQHKPWPTLVSAYSLSESDLCAKGVEHQAEVLFENSQLSDTKAAAVGLQLDLKASKICVKFTIESCEPGPLCPEEYYSAEQGYYINDPLVLVRYSLPSEPLTFVGFAPAENFSAEGTAVVSQNGVYKIYLAN